MDVVRPVKTVQSPMMISRRMVLGTILWGRIKRISGRVHVEDSGEPCALSWVRLSQIKYSFIFEKIIIYYKHQRHNQRSKSERVRTQMPGRGLINHLHLFSQQS